MRIVSMCKMYTDPLHYLLRKNWYVYILCSYTIVNDVDMNSHDKSHRIIRGKDCHRTYNKLFYRINSTIMSIRLLIFVKD